MTSVKWNSNVRQLKYKNHPTIVVRPCVLWKQNIFTVYTDADISEKGQFVTQAPVLCKNKNSLCFDYN